MAICVCVCVRSSRYLVAVKNLLVSNGIDSCTKRGGGRGGGVGRERSRRGRGIVEVEIEEAEKGRKGGSEVGRV